ncbi:hypothetical protein PF007_g21913 [Phytophthora fragariae]|uniref:Uncharacterized protein n=2 Tax=Phytophthora fragariae TaxID=53985 RepID=A0A6A3RV69_9STRA|nr:hypothetical protein PF003_g28906 [Phytophthora fragariae]KAE8983063.1 hypothetical protein PF011_g21356 [Phytophthora fragariae]KAE9083398.1 hypothetical protein PF007_g21913 [Phytophthora fragariae]KAE9104623.1 hypothetical protein PF006_g21858 [Phytophthora fragariae]
MIYGNLATFSLKLSSTFSEPRSQSNFTAARRIKQARVQRMAYEVANTVQFGAITSHHLDVVNARRSESAPFEVPQDNTTTQAMELDRQREALQQQQQDTEREAPATAVISVRLNGLWMPLEIDILSLRRAIRRALRLPDHDMFSRGIYHEFTPAQPTNASMDDEDHAEEMSTD